MFNMYMCEGLSIITCASQEIQILEIKGPWAYKRPEFCISLKLSEEEKYISFYVWTLIRFPAS